MAFCSNCGAEVQGKFCARCGTPNRAAAVPGSSGAPPEPPPAYSAPPPPPPPQSAPLPPPATPLQAPGLEENMACALCFLLGFVTRGLFFFFEPHNKKSL